MFAACILFGVLLVKISATSTCGDGKVRCLKSSNETCIPHFQWCDGEYDCVDGTDEMFCDGRECPDLFACSNRKCIPHEAVCNGYDNCGDGSDETCAGIRNVTRNSNSLVAVVEAVHYLLSQRKSDYGWDDFTARALIGLAFAEEYSQIPEKEKVAMMKRLDLQILFLLKDGVENLARLAVHVNALYAMCKDPRDFHGIDLVELLRSETDKAMKSDFNLPIVIMTLCIANESRNGDFDKLVQMYRDKKNHRIGVKALTLIAMNSCNRQARGRYNRSYDAHMTNFIGEYSSQDNSIDVYSKALVCQAFNARGYESSLRKELLSHQADDGSFGDLIGTYAVIPALLNTSLADLQCKTRQYKKKSARLELSSSEQIFKPERSIDYSLWIPTGENAGFHTLRITYEGEKTFYDLMKMAEYRNPMYRFKYDELKGTGKKVYYLAGIPNDAEKGSSWTLYRQVADRIVKNSTTNKRKETDGVDRIFPQDGEHFLFQLEYGKML